MMTVSTEEMVQRMKDLPNLRQVVVTIDPRQTPVAILPDNLDAARYHYGKYCTPLPEIHCLNGDIDPSLRDRIARGRALCLFSPESEFWSRRGIGETFLKARSLGLGESYLIDAEGIKQNFDWMFMPPMEPAFIIENLERITRCYNAIGDQDSRDIFLGGLKFRLTGEAGFIPFTSVNQYDHPMVHVEPGDVIYDAGIGMGAEGATLGFLERIGPSGRIFAFEANPGDWAYLEAAFSRHPNLDLVRAGLWSSTGTQAFHVNGHASTVARQGQGDISCPLLTLDSHVDSTPDRRCDFIKFDIEGAEPDALRGALATLRRTRPKLAISIYHEPFRQFVEILAFLVELDLGYVFYLGQHSPTRLETVLYARPA